MGRSQIRSILKRSACHFYSYGHHDLYQQSTLFRNMPKIYTYTIPTLQGQGHVPYSLGGSLQQHRSSLSLQVTYYNNVFRYTTSSNSKRNGPETEVRLLKNGFTPRAWAFRLGIVSSALLVFISAGLFLHYNDERRAIPKASQGSGRNMEISKPSIGGPFKLINYEGKPVTYSDLSGKWTLMYFGYTSSPDIDPEEVQKMARAIAILESKENLRVNAVFITIDPFRDTPSQLRAYLQEFDPRIVGLTGPENAIRQVAQEFRVYFKKTDVEGPDYLVDCSHNMYLMNPDMEFVRMFGLEYNAEILADAVASEAKKISKYL